MHRPKWLDPEEMAAWRAFIEASSLLHRQLDQQLKEDSGLSHAQYEILVSLSGAPGGELRMTELAELLITSKSGLTYQIGQLENAGLVRRRACEFDVRGVFAVLTDAGREGLRDAAPGHVALVRRLFVDVLAREDLALLTATFGAVASRIRQHGAR